MKGRRRRVLMLCTVLGFGLAAAPLGWASPATPQSGGQGSSSISVLVSGPAGEKILDVEDAQVAVHGDLVVRFHGDRNSDCLPHGLCGYRGQIVLHPESQGFITVAKYRVHHHLVHEVTVFLDSGEFGSGDSDGGFASHTVRSVNGSDVGLCADASESGLGSTVDSRSNRLTLSLLHAGGGVLTTRCAGPMDGDVASAGPQVTVSAGSLTHPGRTIDFSGTHGFASHGFAGTVTSTISLRIQSVHREHLGSGTTKGKTVRVRFVTEKLDLIRMSGGFTIHVRGALNQDVCVLLDSCGVAGTLSWSPVPGPATAELTATGLARRPRRDFLAALGLGGAGNPRGISVFGGVSWKESGSLLERITQGGGTCTDTTRLGSGGVALGVRRSDLAATYVPFNGLRTRCPGPFVNLSNVAAGRLPRSGFDRRRFTIKLLSKGSVRDDGYAAALSGHLALVMKHTGKTTQQVTAVPAAAFGGFP